MSDDLQERARAIVQRATQLIEEARRGADELDDVLRREGLDAAKARTFAEASLPPEGARMLEEQLAQDAADVERQVAQARVEARPGEEPHHSRRPHTLI